jgi:hypothetical protein
MSESSVALADVRTALVRAVAADVRRRRRIRFVATVAAAATLLGVLASGTAAGSGWLFGAPAPPRVAKELHRFEESTPPPHVRVVVTPGIPLGQSTAVASAPGYTLYLLRTAEHECFSVEPNGGESCGPLEASSAPVDLISYEVDTAGGGTVYGRAPGAATVAITVPGVPQPVIADVDPRTGYFIALLPNGSAVQALPLVDWPVTAGPG